MDIINEKDKLLIEKEKELHKLLIYEKEFGKQLNTFSMDFKKDKENTLNKEKELENQIVKLKIKEQKDQEKMLTQEKENKNKRKAEAFINKRNKNKTNIAGQVYQDCRGSTWCPACGFYKQKLHKCKKVNLWLNIDVINKIVIAGDSISDIQCTNEEDRNINTIVYYN